MFWSPSPLLRVHQGIDLDVAFRTLERPFRKGPVVDARRRRAREEAVLPLVQLLALQPRWLRFFNLEQG